MTTGAGIDIPTVLQEQLEKGDGSENGGFLCNLFIDADPVLVTKSSYLDLLLFDSPHKAEVEP